MLLLVFSFEFHFDTLLEKWLRPITNEYFFEPFFFSSFLYLIFNTSLTVSSINFNIQFYFLLLLLPPTPNIFRFFPRPNFPKWLPNSFVETFEPLSLDGSTSKFERFLYRITPGSSSSRMPLAEF